MLGDFGAKVVKVEHPKGDPLRAHGAQKEGQPLLWKTVNRNKLGATLDLKKEADAATFRGLAAKADVIIENFRPGTMSRWGLGWDDLHAINSRLVLTSVTGFGQTGPYASRPGFGTLAEALSGFAYITGSPDGPPTLPPFGLADGVCAMAGTWATLIALYNRDALGGDGQWIDLSILEPLVTILGAQASAYQQLGQVQERRGNRSANNAPRNTYVTADGRWVALSTSSDNIAARLIELVGRGDLVSQPWFGSARGRFDHVEELDAAVAEWVGARALDEVVNECEKAEAAVAPIYSIAELVHDPHVVERGTFTTVEDEVLGPLLMQNVFARLSATPGGIRTTGPGLGEHNELVHAIAAEA
jgi:formyl-CoA transferase